ncbi:disease resistance protein L6-like [Rhodamnia argentea]|uniref:Disease resistance protein L6-like n=1 Tax=Rhodamnia argentea TaxID=178133 RepID=A0ABM3HJ79_9MYRT|nr:disease resistance protein L6-like [Rhodamnia argentea]
MEKGQSQRKANRGMHRFVLGRPFVMLVAPILLSVLVFNHLRKKKKSAEKESSEVASAPSFVSPIPARGGSHRYDIFLSFRGSDTRKGFTDHLYRSLVNAGTVPICVFRDDKNLPIGEEFGSQLLDAITQSKISIPIISENYASSKWCLRELIHIMDCKKSVSHMSRPHIVLPIFYKVDPSDVRHLEGSFGKSFLSRKKQFDEKDIQEGKRALEEVSYLSGWESEKIANGHEGELVERVIKTVLSTLQRDFQLDVTKHLVGIDDHVNNIRNWVDTPASHARMIGIYGMGGIGKTTFAKVIYNELSDDFVHRSFLPDIRETALRKGIPYLQDLLIKEIQRNEHQVCIVDDGINLIQSTLKGKKVLILLDDVDHQDQLNALARERDWFTTGSIIIVTTRYKAVLDQSEFRVDYMHELNELDEVHSLLLFKRHAFRMSHCAKDFEGISRDILSTMGGLPLAIKVIGSYLYGKTDRKVWQDVLKKLRSEPDRDVQKTLKISYDALEPKHKEIYLDIACFFVGEDSKFAMYMWEDCVFYPNQGIEELKLRCLIKIGDCGRFRIHDQLRDLGRNIFCQGQRPERCLKLWFDEIPFKARPLARVTHGSPFFFTLSFSYV